MKNALLEITLTGDTDDDTRLGASQQIELDSLEQEKNPAGTLLQIVENLKQMCSDTK
jgi:hypothetical protein